MNLSMNGNDAVRKKLGELVSSENEKNWWRQELFEKHTKHQIPNELQIINPPPAEEENYNCFVYALGLQNDRRFLGNGGWELDRKLEILFDEMIKSNVLQSLPKAKPGSLVVYRSKDGRISHAGLMENADTVISKWSWGPLLRHKVFDVPNHYGDEVTFYNVTETAKQKILSSHAAP
jgi:hypothetical protein